VSAKTLEEAWDANKSNIPDPTPAPAKGIEIHDEDGPAFVGGKGGKFRAVKMLKPMCGQCQHMDQSPGWAVRCIARGHDPYIQRIVTKLRVPTYGEWKDGSRTIKSYTEMESEHYSPNITEVPATGRHNGNQGIQKARGDGYLFLEERGLKARCQLHQCWKQLDSTSAHTPFGSFCSTAHAAIVAADAMQVFPGGSPQKAHENRQRVLAALSLDAETLKEILPAPAVAK
jgi:hypothetical protein